MFIAKLVFGVNFTFFLLPRIKTRTLFTSEFSHIIIMSILTFRNKVFYYVNQFQIIGPKLVVLNIFNYSSK